MKEMSFNSGVKDRGSDRYGESKVGDCDEVIRTERGETGGE